MSKVEGERYQLSHPRGLSMPAIDKAKYELVAGVMREILSDGEEWRHAPLFEELGRRLAGRLDGSINWYGEWVKLDFEARGIVERISKRPLRWKLK